MTHRSRPRATAPAFLRVPLISNAATGAYLLHGNVVGCLDIVRGHPEPHIAFLGLLLFAEEHQGRGYGRLALRHIRGLVGERDCTALRLAVIETNVRAQRFWRREGFDELYRQRTTQYTGAAVFMETAV
jgi:ribosomal protein S18 acetylase RimI-like enzyme